MVHGGQCLERHIQGTKTQWEKNQRKRRENKRRKNKRINEWREKAAEERMDEMDLVEWPVGESGNGNWNEEFSLPYLGQLVEDTAEDNRKGKKGDSKRGSGTLEITLNKGMQEIHARVKEREVILVGGRMDMEIRVVVTDTNSTSDTSSLFTTNGMFTTDTNTDDMFTTDTNADGMFTTTATRIFHSKGHLRLRVGSITAEN